MGVLLSLLWDGFRILHLATGKNRSDPPRLVSLFLGDVVYALIAAVSMILLTYYVNFGRFRWFSFAGAGLGFFSWRATGGRVLMAFADRLLCALRALLSLLFRPFALLFRLIGKKAGALVGRAQSGKLLKNDLKRVKRRFSSAKKERKSGKKRKRKKESKTV